MNIELPENALPHILMMHLSHAWLVILLYRPFYRPFAGLLSSETHNEAGTSQSGHVAWAVKVRSRRTFETDRSNVTMPRSRSFTS
jgi:hypothetical protein